MEDGWSVHDSMESSGHPVGYLDAIIRCECIATSRACAGGTKCADKQHFQCLLCSTEYRLKVCTNITG